MVPNEEAGNPHIRQDANERKHGIAAVKGEANGVEALKRQTWQECYNGPVREEDYGQEKPQDNRQRNHEAQEEVAALPT